MDHSNLQTVEENPELRIFRSFTKLHFLQISVGTPLSVDEFFRAFLTIFHFIK